MRTGRTGAGSATPITVLIIGPEVLLRARDLGLLEGLFSVRERLLLEVSKENTRTSFGAANNPESSLSLQSLILPKSDSERLDTSFPGDSLCPGKGQFSGNLASRTILRRVSWWLGSRSERALAR
jgi:hypothetical protein